MHADAATRSITAGVAAAFTAASLFLVGCGDAKLAGARPSGGAEPPTVTTVAARTEPFKVEIEALGTAIANETVEITSEAAHRVAAIHFAEGTLVKRGAVLVELESAELRAELALAEAALAESRQQFERSRNLYASRALSDAQLAQIESVFKMNQARLDVARVRLAYTQIRAPFTGRTGFRRVSPGGLVSPGTVITTLDDTSIIKIDFTVPQTLIASLSRGLEVKAQAAGLADRTFEGRITVLGSRVDPVSRSVTARAEIRNEDEVLKPGMFLSVLLEAGSVTAVVIPEGALVSEQGKSFVFVVDGGVARRREVQVGRRRVGEIQITQGLADRDQVIVDGSDRVRDAMRVVEARAPGGPGGAASMANGSP